MKKLKKSTRITHRIWAEEKFKQVTEQIQIMYLNLNGMARALDHLCVVNGVLLRSAKMSGITDEQLRDAYMAEAILFVAEKNQISTDEVLTKFPDQVISLLGFDPRTKEEENKELLPISGADIFSALEADGTPITGQPEGAQIFGE